MSQNKLDRIVLGFILIFLAIFGLSQHKKFSDYGYTTRDDMYSDFSYSQTPEDILLLNPHPEVKFRLRSGIDLFFNRVVDIWKLGVENIRIFNQITICLGILIFWFCVFNSNFFQALLFICLFYFFIPNYWEHNIITSYPIFFHVAFIFSCLSFYLIRKGKRWPSLFLGSLLMLISNFEYEVIASINLIVLLYLMFEVYTKKIKLFSKQTLLPLLFYCIYVSSYLTFMLIKRNDAIVSGAFDGYNVSFSIMGALKVLATYSLSYFPGVWHSGFQHFASKWDPYVLSYLPLNNLFLTLIFGACIISLFYFLSNREKTSEKSYLNISIKTGIFISLGFIFFPQIPISLTSKYQSWVSDHHSIAFTSSYFSYFGTISLLVWLATYLVDLKNCFLRRMTITLLVIFLLISVFRHNQFQAKVDVSMLQSKARWVVMESFLKSETYNLLNEGEIVDAHSLYSSNTEIAVVPFNYWSLYSIKYGKKRILIVDDKDVDYKKYTSVGKFRLIYKGAIDHQNSFLTFIDKERGSLALFDYGKRKGIYRVIYKCDAGECTYDVQTQGGAYEGNSKSLDILRVDRLVDI